MSKIALNRSLILILFMLLFIPIHCQISETTTPDSTGISCTYSGPGRCPNGFVCLKSGCARRCFFMGHCPSGFKCQGNFVCVKTICLDSDSNCCSNCPEKCLKSEDCPQGWGCIFKKCRRVECQSKNDCEFGWPCSMGKCKAKTCSNDSECPENWICSSTRRCTRKSKKI